jgi:hypothetical protein
MSKITFRADDDLVERLEGLDTSKSEVMREALRAYLDPSERSLTRRADSQRTSDSLDGALATRVDELVRERVDAILDVRLGDRPVRPQDVNVNLTVDGGGPVTSGVNATESAGDADADDRKTTSTADSAGKGCEKCGEHVAADHVYCPNCGEKANHRVFCECGDELRSDWAFCPGCGRRTSTADVLEPR